MRRWLRNAALDAVRTASGLAALALGVVGAFPETVSACSVCFSAKNEENQIAYLASTGFLTFLPLLLVGALLLWVRKRTQDTEQPRSPDHS
ncbi:MAG: hypothetical protein OXU20_25430 [Myxococcales bacterium]|nr:hypothetical protein [Myxococcales bacterium]MDD9965908.1 hypothetical protein [Myxococcales bacterium]